MIFSYPEHYVCLIFWSRHLQAHVDVIPAFIIWIMPYAKVLTFSRSFRTWITIAECFLTSRHFVFPHTRPANASRSRDAGRLSISASCDSKLLIKLFVLFNFSE